LDSFLTKESTNTLTMNMMSMVYKAPKTLGCKL
jgi:hypothetical protein